MLKRVICLWFFLMLVSGCHNYDTSSEHLRLYKARLTEPSQTVVVAIQACTGCTETGLVNSRLQIPPDLKEVLGDTARLDIQLAGKFPFDLLDYTQINLLYLRQPHAFKVSGKVIDKFHDDNLESTVPLFYVEQWEVVQNMKE